MSKHNNMRIPSSSIIMSLLMEPSNNLQVVACWSKAGIGTSVVLEYRQQQQQQQSNSNQSSKGNRIVLDLGATPCYDETLAANVVLISHGHLDHIGAIFSHARAVSCKGGVVPTYYVPSEILSFLDQAKQSMCALDSANDGSAGTRDETILQMKVIGVNAGEEHVLPLQKHLNGVRLFIRVFGVQHAGCPAVGYIIGSRHPSTLREEYKGKSHQEIRDLITSGIQIKTDPQDVLELAYTGDTSVEGLRIPAVELGVEPTNIYLPQVFSCPILIVEATFLEDNEQWTELALRRGHMCIADVVSVLNDQCWHGEELLLMHLSARYSAASALDHILTALPEELTKKCWVALSAAMSTHSTDEESFRDLIKSNGCIRLYDYAQRISTIKNSV